MDKSRQFQWMVSWTCILFFVKNPDTPPAANKTAMALSNVFRFLFINHSLLYPKTCFYRIPREVVFSILFTGPTVAVSSIISFQNVSGSRRLRCF